MKYALAALLGGLLLGFAGSVSAEEGTGDTAPPNADSSGGPMDNARLETLIKRIDPDVEGEAGRWKLEYDDATIYVVTDEQVNRMRIMTPIASA